MLHCGRAETYVALPKIFAPGRLATVRDLHVLLGPAILEPTDMNWLHSRPADLALADICAILQALPGIFPRLRCFAVNPVCLECQLWKNSTQEHKLVSTERLLLLIDETVVRLRHLDECTVGLPTSVWGPWVMEVTGEPPRKGYDPASDEAGMETATSLGRIQGAHRRGVE